ncbi:MAG: hypothetical protein WC551_08975 [Patescibacteria group bacterium]
MTKRRTPIDKLSGDAVDSVVRTMDWTEELGEDLDGWTCYEVTECSSCGHKYVVGLGCSECPKCGHESDPIDGPMMNYFYPVPFLGSCEDAAKALGQTCVCVVELSDGTRGLALTGGGMDLSWEIARAHVSLGFLPPAWLRLPRMAGWENYGDAAYMIKVCLAGRPDLPCFLGPRGPEAP